MAASKPTSWLSKHSHLLYTIAEIWGPYTTVWTLLLLAMKLRSHCLTLREHTMEFGVCFGWIPRRLTNDSVLYLHRTLYHRLALKLFQREPAITRFDWNFSAMHSSSQTVAAVTGSVLLLILLRTQPDHA
jgi:hypothetical protein